MTKHGMRGFASGVIATTAVVALFYFQVTPKSEATTANNAPITEKSVQNYLNEQGEIAVDKETFNQWQESEKQKETAAKSNDSDKKPKDKSSDKSSQDDKSKEDTSKTNKEETKTDVNKATVQVTEGMTTSDVASKLASQHVIKDKYDLINYVVSHKLEPYLQLGTFTLSSDMTIEQIANKITSR